MKALLPSFTLASALLLAGCGGDVADGQPDGGLYAQEVKVTDIPFPGMTDAERMNVTTQMEQGSGNGQTFCLGAQDTPEWTEIVDQLSQGMGGDCNELMRDQTDSSVKAEIECKGAPQGDIVAKVDASSADESFEADMSFDIKNEQFDQEARVALTMKATRIGDCPGQ